MSTCFGGGDNERYLKAINICLNDSGVDGILIIYIVQGDTRQYEPAKTVTEISKKACKPTLTSWIGGGVIKNRLLQYTAVTSSVC